MVFLIRLILKVFLCLLVMVVGFFVIAALDEIFFAKKYIQYEILSAFILMLLTLPWIARMRMGKRQV